MRESACKPSVGEMPEARKATLKQQLTDELAHVLNAGRISGSARWRTRRQIRSQYAPEEFQVVVLAICDSQLCRIFSLTD